MNKARTVAPLIREWIGQTARRAVVALPLVAFPLLSCSVEAQQISWTEFERSSPAPPGHFREQTPAVSTTTSATPAAANSYPISDDAISELRNFVDVMKTSQAQTRKPSTTISVSRQLDSEVQTPVRSDVAAVQAANVTAVQSQLQHDSQIVLITLEQLLIKALAHSSQVKVYSDLPMIRQTSITEAQAAFDPAVFLDSRWDDQNDPVGNTLTTGGASRYKNNQYSGAGGLRKRTSTGGQVEVAERIGYQNTNSTFFVPNPQGTSKLVLNYTQPLMRGKGKKYNESLTVLAQIDKGVAEEEFSRQLQSHLLEVSRSYWGLYLERSLLSQKRRSLERAEHVRRLLVDRVGIDAVKPQIQRAEAEVATRQSDLIRAELAVKNAEARIRALVNDPELGDSESNVELIPMDEPSELPSQVDLAQSLATALQTRPEINQAIHQIKAGCVRHEISKNELMPSLNLITEAYLSGLQNNGDIGGAFADNFSVGAPSYSIGLQFEVPLNNRAAKSRNERRRIELRQLQNQYQTTIHTLSLEVEVAVRELETSFAEMNAQKRAVEASAAQLDYLQKRWEFLPGENGNGSLMLDNLLTAQERLVTAENAHTQAWITYNLAIINHQRATGELLTAQDIAWGVYVDECEGVTTRMIHKPMAEEATP